jgi:hypothetical protein
MESENFEQSRQEDVSLNLNIQMKEIEIKLKEIGNVNRDILKTELKETQEAISRINGEIEFYNSDYGEESNLLDPEKSEEKDSDRDEIIYNKITKFLEEKSILERTEEYIKDELQRSSQEVVDQLLEKLFNLTNKQN